ncbi:MAG TPA: tetratricopeptide repeat protein [Paludibacteraceae bacterium]|nr:tetratricopeptide repeat protein [Paludibacteraceae bacterium]
MRSNDFDLTNEELAIIKNYEEANKKGHSEYFDVEDLEFIIEHYLHLGNVENAQNALRFALKLHPDSSHLQCKKARIYTSLGRFEEALDLINQFQEEGNPAHIFTKAEILLKTDHKQEAVILFKELVNAYAEDDLAEICLDIVMMLHVFQDYHHSSYFIQKGLKKDPKNLDLLVEYAVYLEQLNESEKAIEIYNRILDIEPYKSSAWFCLGLLHFNLEQYREALNAFDFNIAINPNDTIAWLQKGHCHFNLEEYVPSIKAYKKYLTDYPEDSVVTAFLGECYENCEVYDLALTYFLQAAKLNPGNGDAWLGAAICMVETEEYHKGFEYIKKAIDANPDSAENYAVLGEILDKNNLIEESKIAYLHSLELEQKQPETWKELGDLYMQSGEFEQAVPCYEKAFEQDPTLDKLTLLMSMAYYAIKDYDKTLDFFSLAKQTYSNALEIFLSVFPEAKSLLIK